MRLIDADALKTELEKLRDGWNYYGGEYESAMYQAYDISVDTVDEQPTVQPQRKIGRWIDVYGEVPIFNAGGFTETKHIGWKCSECEKQTFFQGNYCPNCGAYMGGEEDEVNN